ncbi:hypothetical protein B0H19DRAFT_1071974 [Mycena capillaripes]|nr:hypothetical protein B0H19DRAFT_1071974 [Mycena capillaripes]
MSDTNAAGICIDSQHTSIACAGEPQGEELSGAFRGIRCSGTWWSKGERSVQFIVISNLVPSRNGVNINKAKNGKPEAPSPRPRPLLPVRIKARVAASDGASECYLKRFLETFRDAAAITLFGALPGPGFAENGFKTARALPLGMIGFSRSPDRFAITLEW